MMPDRSRVRKNWWIAAAVSAISAGTLTWAPAPALQAQTQVDAVISSGGGGAAVRYAVPDFAAATPELAAIGRTIGEVLWDDLNFEREFYMIPRDTYASVPRVAPGALPLFASWRELGADAVVTGTVERVGDRLRVDFRLFRVASQQQVLAQRYEGDARNPRRVA